ncbi:MAG: polysaccharide biosynthesis tyrosine autokinase [Elusimicrobiota bacterium]
MAQYELNLHDYWRIVKKRRWTILFTLSAIVGSVMVFTKLQTPVYQATATVKVEPQMEIRGISTGQSDWDYYTALNTEVKIIKSALVAERAGIKLGLITSEMTETQKEPIIAAIQGKISAERVGDTNLINISAASSNPAETAKLANATANVYIEKGIDDRSRRARELRIFVEQQLTEAETKLKKAENDLRSYGESAGAKGMGNFLATRLLDMQTRRTDLLKKYTEQHPEVKKMDQQMKDLETQMQAMPAEEREYARLARELRINEELYVLLAKRYKEAQISEADRVQSAFIVTPAIVPGAPVKPNKMVNLLVGIVLGFIIGFVLALLIENMDTSIGTIEDVEKFLSLPVLGIIPHIEPDAKFKTLLEKSAGRTEQKVINLRSKLIVYHTVKSPFVEAYHTLRTNLKFALPKEKGNILAFVSAGISEGKTISAANYALAAAQSGIKTLLIEADLRRPTIHRIFGLPRDPGFSDCLIGMKRWTEVTRGMTDFVMSELSAEVIIQYPGIENLGIITSGPIPPNPIDMFNSPELQKIVFEMKEQYDLIVLDCPPVLLFADSLILGTIATGTIIVYQVGRMARGALKRAKDTMLNVKVPVLGVILNDITAIEMEPHYGYYHNYKYYTSPEEPKKPPL